MPSFEVFPLDNLYCRASREPDGGNAGDPVETPIWDEY